MAYRIVYRREDEVDDWKNLLGKVRATNPVTDEPEIHRMHVFESREDAVEFRDRFNRIENRYEYQIKKVPERREGKRG